MSRCPSENTFAEYLEDRLAGTACDAFDEHVRGCEHCSMTLNALSAAASLKPSSLSSSQEASPPSSVASPPWPECSTVVGRYSTQEVIGVGGMGIVYLALDAKLHRKVALKVTRAEVSRAGALRLFREAQAMAQLSHRNVVAVHDVGMWHEHVFLAMEYMEGGTLTRYLLDRQPNWSEVLQRFIEAGTGLAAAHEAGLVHRDFKTDNVLLSASGEARVADFGLACVLGSPAVASSAAHNASDLELHNALRAHLTRMGSVLGTPGYMAPEQIRGQPVDHRADIWSYCAALYEALYCELPFPGRTPREVLKYAEAGSFRRAPHGSRVPRWLRRALLAGLHADTAKRIPTMVALLGLLERGASKRWRRGPVLTVAAIVGCVVGGAGLSFSGALPATPWSRGAARGPGSSHPSDFLPARAPSMGTSLAFAQDSSNSVHASGSPLREAAERVGQSVSEGRLSAAPAARTDLERALSQPTPAPSDRSLAFPRVRPTSSSAVLNRRPDRAFAARLSTTPEGSPPLKPTATPTGSPEKPLDGAKSLEYRSQSGDEAPIILD